MIRLIRYILLSMILFTGIAYGAKGVATDGDLFSKIRLSEGASKYVYKDHLGYSTIGIGRNVDPRSGRGLTNKDMEYLLAEDVEHCRDLLDEYPWFLKQDQVRRDALIEMAFNMGIYRLLGFKKMIKALGIGDYKTAYKEALDSHWKTQVGSRAKRIAHSFISDELE